MSSADSAKDGKPRSLAPKSQIFSAFSKHIPNSGIHVFPLGND